MKVSECNEIDDTSRGRPTTTDIAADAANAEGP
jgi:hypothetical protein